MLFQLLISVVYERKYFKFQVLIRKSIEKDITKNMIIVDHNLYFYMHF